MKPATLLTKTLEFQTARLSYKAKTNKEELQSLG